MIRLSAILMLLFWVASDAIAQKPELRQHIQEKLDQWCRDQHIPGASLAVHAGSESWTWTSGFADVENKIPMGPEAMLFSGSVGKTYVSALTLRLIAEGKLDLDTRIHDFFGREEWYNCLPNADQLTLKMLMNHTSGLGRYIFQPSFMELMKNDPFTKVSPQDALRHLCGTEAVHPPGKGWSYSDSNYLIIGLLIEKIWGRSYYDILQSELLGPLGLEKTLPTTTKTLPGLTPGYIGEHNFFELPEKVIDGQGNYVMDPSFEFTGGGLYCTTADLAEWIYSLHSGRVLPDSIYNLLIAPVDFRSGEPAGAGYGLGTFVWNTPRGKHYGHAGMFPGYLTQVEHNRELGLTVALQVNTDGSDMRSMHGLILQLVDIM